MATRSAIGILQPDGTIRAIYCHWDGYPLGGVGGRLLSYYKDPQTINKLLDLGDLSSLGTIPVSDAEYWNRSKETNDAAPKDGGLMSFEKLMALVLASEKATGNRCVSYRDRGETDIDARTFKTQKAFVSYFSKRWCDYIYLFKRDQWFYTTGSSFRVLNQKYAEASNV